MQDILIERLAGQGDLEPRCCCRVKISTNIRSTVIVAILMETRVNPSQIFPRDLFRQSQILLRRLIKAVSLMPASQSASQSVSPPVCQPASRSVPVPQPAKIRVSGEQLNQRQRSQLFLPVGRRGGLGHAICIVIGWLRRGRGGCLVPAFVRLGAVCSRSVI